MVLLNDFVLPNLLDVSFRPVGSAARARGSFRVDDRYDVTGIAALGELNTPNPEAVAALDPDLLLGLGPSREQYATYAAIAPPSCSTRRPTTCSGSTAPSSTPWVAPRTSTPALSSRPPRGPRTCSAAPRASTRPPCRPTWTRSSPPRATPPACRGNR